MHSIMDPTVGTSAGSIVEPTDVLTMDIHIPTEAMEATEPTEDTEDMEDIILTHTGYIIVHFSGDGLITNAVVGTSRPAFFPEPALKREPIIITLHQTSRGGDRAGV
jgi:hypothetical protein